MLATGYDNHVLFDTVFFARRNTTAGIINRSMGPELKATT
jgi:hypothetical protein